MELAICGMPYDIHYVAWYGDVNIMKYVIRKLSCDIVAY